MKVLFSAQALEQYAEWAMTDRKTFRKLNTLIQNCQADLARVAKQVGAKVN